MATETTLENHEMTYTVLGHSTIVNQAGIILIGYPNGWGTRFEPRAAIAHAEYILAHREQLQKLQDDLELRWREVALEVKRCFEQECEEDLTFAEASSHEIEFVLERLAGLDRSGYHYVHDARGCAGTWFRSLWNEDRSDSLTHEQEWNPFLRVCCELQEQDKRER